MNKGLASGLTGAAPIWNRVMSGILEGKDNEKFPIPEQIVILRDDDCPNKYEVFNKNDKVPDKICVKKSDKDDDKEDEKKD